MEIQQINAKVTCLQSGQARPYADSYYKYRVETAEELDRQTLISITQRWRRNTKWRTKKEWKEGYGNANIYFEGYCEISKEPYGYYVEYCEPFTD